MPMRVTTGRFVNSGRVFSCTDDWTRRADAHRELEDYWVGKTKFFIKTQLSERKRNPFSAGHFTGARAMSPLPYGSVEL